MSTLVLKGTKGFVTGGVPYGNKVCTLSNGTFYVPFYKGTYLNPQGTMRKGTTLYPCKRYIFGPQGTIQGTMRRGTKLYPCQRYIFGPQGTIN